MLNINEKTIIFLIIIILGGFLLRNLFIEKMSDDKPKSITKESDRIIFKYNNKKTIVFKNNPKLASRTIYKDGRIDKVIKIGSGSGKIQMKESVFNSVKLFKKHIDLNFNENINKYLNNIKNKKVKIIVKYNIKNEINKMIIKEFKINKVNKNTVINVRKIDDVTDDIVQVK